MRISAIRIALINFNKNICQEDHFTFDIIDDRSLVFPRKKELHNVLVNRNCKVFAVNDAKEKWSISTKRSYRTFTGTLDECFSYCIDKGYCSTK